jgi:uncharacterized membrane protein
MKEWIMFILILLLITAGIYIVILRENPPQSPDVELLQVETEALYKIKADLEAELIALDKKSQINKIHEKYRKEFMDSDFIDKLEYISRSDVEALRVFDRHNQ